MKITIDFKDSRVERPRPKTAWDQYIIVGAGGMLQTVSYNRKLDLFNARTAETLEAGMRTAIFPRWWAEIPPELEILEDYDYEYNSSVPKKDIIHAR